MALLITSASTVGIPDLRVATHQEAIKEAISLGADPNSPMSIYKTIVQMEEVKEKISLSTVKRHYKDCLEP